MKKDQLKNFVEVADCGSINKAAEKLYISQPSLSRSIHALEEEMGENFLSAQIVVSPLHLLVISFTIMHVRF